MPVKGDRGTFTRQEQLFAESYAVTGDTQYAAEKAGYASPAKRGYDALSRPAVQEEIAKLALASLNNEMLPKAMKKLDYLLTAAAVPAGAAFQAVKYVLDHTLFTGDAANGKAPHEMTGDELARQLDRLRLEASQRSGKVIDVTPNEPEQTDVFA